MKKAPTKSHMGMQGKPKKTQAPLLHHKNFSTGIFQAEGDYRYLTRDFSGTNLFT